MNKAILILLIGLFALLPFSFNRSIPISYGQSSCLSSSYLACNNFFTPSHFLDLVDAQFSTRKLSTSTAEVIAPATYPNIFQSFLQRVSYHYNKAMSHI